MYKPISTPTAFAANQSSALGGSQLDRNASSLFSTFSTFYAVWVVRIFAMEFVASLIENVAVLFCVCMCVCGKW